MGIIGALGAGRIVDEKTDPVPLSPLVEQLAINIYYNPSQQLQFLMPPSLAVPGLSSERGRPLAEYMSAAVNRTHLGSRFSAGQVVASASRQDLKDLGEVVLLSNMSEAEANLLIEGILPATPSGQQENRRVASYACVLGLADILSRLPNEDDFFTESYRVTRLLPKSLAPYMTGWLRYLVRDALAVAHEHLLQCVVIELLASGATSVARHSVVEGLLSDAHTYNAVLDSFGLRLGGENALDLPFKELHTRLENLSATDRIVEAGMARWSSSLSELGIIETVRSNPSASAMCLPILWSLATFRTSSWDESAFGFFEEHRGLGWSAIGVRQVIAPDVQRFISEGWLLRDVMAELTMRTVDQHLRVSWSRMAVDTRHDVALLISEGDRWQGRSEQKHVKDYRAGRTASRLSQVVNWLQQLGLIDASGLTEQGRLTYQRVLKTLTPEVRVEAA